MARDTELNRAHGIAAHYVREAPKEILACPAALRRHLAIKNRADDSCLDAAARDLLILLPRSAVLDVGFDGWDACLEWPTLPLGLELHGLRLTATQLNGHRILDFTWQWREGAWLGEDFHLELTD